MAYQPLNQWDEVYGPQPEEEGYASPYGYTPPNAPAGYGQGYTQPEYEASYGQGYAQPEYEASYGQGYVQPEYEASYGQGYVQPEYEANYGQGYAQPEYEASYGQGYVQPEYEASYGQGYAQPEYEASYGQGYVQPEYEASYGQGYAQPEYEASYGQEYAQPAYGAEPDTVYAEYAETYDAAYDAEPQGYAPVYEAGYERDEQEADEALLPQYDDDLEDEALNLPSQVRRPAKHFTRLLMAAGILLLVAGIAVFATPIVQKAYYLYQMEDMVRQFGVNIAQRKNFQAVVMDELPEPEVIDMPLQYADDMADPNLEDASDYYDEEGNVRQDIGTAPLRAQVPPDFILEIPKINLKIGVYKTKKMQEIYGKMRVGAGMYPTAAMPGTKGNTTIAAHRTGPSDFFRKLDQLDPGDVLIIHGEEVSYKYVVEKRWIVAPTEWSVLSKTDYSAITLTTCQAYNGVSNGRRLIVRGKLTEEARDQV